MPLTLVLGPANSAKAGEVLGGYAADAPRGALLVVPTALDARHYAVELAVGGTVLGSVVTFSGLAAEIARRADYAGRTVTDLQRGRILQRLLSRSRWEAFGASATAVGFAAAAGDLIAELQRALISPDRLRAALRAWAAQDVRRAAHARELSRIYAGYVQELERLGRVDRELYAWRALDALRESPWRWGESPVYFYGFDDLTALERDAVETLARVVGAAVTVSLTYEPGRPALAARAETVEELRPLAEQVVELPAQDTHYASGARAVLHHLERGLFTQATPAETPDRRPDPRDAVTLLEAAGERAEAELVAGEVLALLGRGVAASEIAVVYRSTAGVAPLLRQVFAGYGIPLHAAGTVALRHTPLGRGLLGAARCALGGDGRAADLLAYLRTSGVTTDPQLADALERRIRRAWLRSAAQARAELDTELPDLDALAAADHPAAALCELARRLFAAPHRATAPELSDGEQLDARALRALTGAVDQLAELDLTPPPAELIELLGAVPVAADAALPAAGGRDAVLLADPSEIRARRFRAVFICGLQEGEFPRPAAPEPFLSDQQRRELAATGAGVRLRPREDPLAAERYLFYAALSRATEQVFLSYRSADEEGNLALPSPFIADVAELLAPDWPARRRRRLLADVVWEPERAPTQHERRRALAAARGAAAGQPPPPRRRLGAAALSEMRHTRILSAGALEAYGDCPVRWLVERELQPREMTAEPEAITRGSLLHSLLEQLLRRLDGPVSSETLPRAEAILDELLAELPAPEPGTPQAAEDDEDDAAAIHRVAARRAIEADLRRYVRHEATCGPGWRPLALELRFGFDEEPDAADSRLPALALGGDDDLVLIRGVVDRVDVDGAGHAIVRDYKSGAQRQGWSVARWELDRQLQVALYLLVVRRLLGLEPVAGFYQPLRGDQLRPRGVFVDGAPVDRGVYPTDAREAGELETILAAAEQRAVSLAEALRTGRVEPCPQTCSRDGCAYPAICRSQ